MVTFVKKVQNGKISFLQLNQRWNPSAEILQTFGSFNVLSHSADAKQKKRLKLSSLFEV